MAYPSMPVNVDPKVGALITEVVKMVTCRHGLDYVAWYQDEPIWFVKKREDEVVRRVQMAVYRRGDEYVIRLVPDAYLLKDLRVAEHIGEDLIANKIEEVTLSPDFKKDLETKLEKAWERASKLPFP